MKQLSTLTLANKLVLLGQELNDVHQELNAIHQEFAITEDFMNDVVVFSDNSADFVFAPVHPNRDRIAALFTQKEDIEKNISRIEHRLVHLVDGMETIFKNDEPKLVEELSFCHLHEEILRGGEGCYTCTSEEQAKHHASVKDELEHGDNCSCPECMEMKYFNGDDY